MEGKICSVCKEYKLYAEYDLNCGYLDGHNSRCKACRKIYEAEREIRLTTMRPLEACLVEFEKEGATELLERMGYVVYHPTKTIYTQFKERMQRKGVDISDWE